MRLKEMTLAWAEDPLRFKVLEDGERFDADWTQVPPEQQESNFASSLWVFPSQDTPYYPLQNGKV